MVQGVPNASDDVPNASNGAGCTPPCTCSQLGLVPASDIPTVDNTPWWMVNTWASVGLLVLHLARISDFKMFENYINDILWKLSQFSIWQEIPFFTAMKSYFIQPQSCDKSSAWVGYDTLWQPGLRMQFCSHRRMDLESISLWTIWRMPVIFSWAVTLL